MCYVFVSIVWGLEVFRDFYFIVVYFLAFYRVYLIRKGQFGVSSQDLWDGLFFRIVFNLRLFQIVFDECYKVKNVSFIKMGKVVLDLQNKLFLVRVVYVSVIGEGMWGVRVMVGF